MDDNPDEYHVGISEEQCVKCTCLKRSASLKSGMPDKNAEFNEETSLKVRDILNFFYICTRLTFLNVSRPCTDAPL